MNSTTLCLKLTAPWLTPSFLLHPSESNVLLVHVEFQVGVISPITHTQTHTRVLGFFLLNL